MLTLRLNPVSRKYARASLGQNTVEMAVVLPFVLFLIIALFEMGQVFFSYIALVNSARDGSIYASMNPGLTTACPDPIPQVGSSGFLGMDQRCKDYADRVGADTIAGLLDTRSLTLARPLAPSTSLAQPITVTLTYQLRTFTTGISMPFFDRMGLPEVYTLKYSMSMPIRNAYVP